MSVLRERGKPTIANYMSASIERSRFQRRLGIRRRRSSIFELRHDSRRRSGSASEAKDVVGARSQMMDLEYSMLE